MPLDVQTPGHHGDRDDHADLDRQTQHQCALSENLAPHFFVVNRIGAIVHQRFTFRRREQPVGKLVSLNHQTDSLGRFLLEIDNFFSLTAEIRRIQHAGTANVKQGNCDRCGNPGITAIESFENACHRTD